MQDSGQWEYHAERLPDEVDVLNDSMRVLSDAGWELVNATSASTPTRQGTAQVWQVTHTLFWRKRRTVAHT